MNEAVAALAMISLDSADAPRDGAFWSAVLGWEITYSDESAVMLTGPTGAMGFGTVPGYEAPGWPNENGTKQFHFDLAVDDLGVAETRCVELGAQRPDDQPGEDRWRVLLDPSGHPFCLTLAANWG